MAYDYKKLGRRDGENLPGLKTRVLVAPRATFTTLEAPTNAGAVPGDSIVISGSHTFGLTDGWIEMYTTMDTSELTGETIGERDSRGNNPKATAFHPGLYAEALEFAQKAQNDQWIALIERPDGTFIQLGADGLECDITHSVASGKVSGGSNGITFTIETFSKLFIYEGAITMKP